MRSSSLPGKTIKKFWKFPSGGIGNGQFDSTTCSEPTFSFIAVVSWCLALARQGLLRRVQRWCVSATAHRLRDSFMVKKFAHPSGLEISMVTNTITPRLCWTGREAFDALCFHPSGEQNSVCSDVTMKCDLMTLVRTQVMALDFKRNQRWKLCSTAYPRRTHIALSSTCLGTIARGSLQLDSSDRHCFHMQTGRRHFDQNVLEWSVALKSSRAHTLMLLPVHHEA